MLKVSFKEDFNLIITGIGGQGLLTLLRILSEAALLEGRDIKTSELHGLSQRGGSVKVHLRMDQEVYSPLVLQGEADLILALEIQEALKVCYFASRERGTIFLINEFFVPISEKKSSQKISLQKKKNFLKELEKFSKKVIFVPAVDICEKEFGNSLTAGVFLLSFALKSDLLPLKEKSVLQAMKKIILPKYLSLNVATFNLASLYVKEQKQTSQERSFFEGGE